MSNANAATPMPTATATATATTITTTTPFRTPRFTLPSSSKTSSSTSRNPRSPQTPLTSPPPPLPPSPTPILSDLSLLLSSLPPLNPSTLCTTYTLLTLYLTHSSTLPTPPPQTFSVLLTLKGVINLLLKRNYLIQKSLITSSHPFSSSSFLKKQTLLRSSLSRVSSLLLLFSPSSTIPSFPSHSEVKSLS